MNNFIENLIWAILGAIIGIILEKLFPYIKKTCKIIDINKKIKEIEQRKDFADIEVLSCGHPHFSPQHMDIDFSGSAFYLAPSKTAIDTMPPSVGAFSASDSDVILDLLSNCGISLEDVNTVRDEVTQKFLNKQDGMKFNGKKNGISYFDGDSRTCDIKENPILTLRIFTTDYFTHHVITSVMSKHNVALLPGTVKSQGNLFNTFCTALGLSLIVILPQTQQIVITRRGNNIAYNDNKSWIYVSVTEAFTGTDIGPDGTPSLEACLRRGLTEELGVPDNKMRLDSIKFYDLFFEKHFLQMGLVCSIELTKDVDLSQVIAWQAKDKELEIGETFAINNTSHDINDFIEQHRHEMRAQTIYALTSYASRL